MSHLTAGRYGWNYQTYSGECSNKRDQKDFEPLLSRWLHTLLSEEKKKCSAHHHCCHLLISTIVLISSFYSDSFNSDIRRAQMNTAEMQMKSKSLSLCKNVMNFVSKSNVISSYNALPCFDLFKVWMLWRLSFATAHMITVVRWFVLTSPCFANRPLANFVRSGECARLRMVFTNQLKSHACAFSIKVCLIKYWLCKY